VAAHFVLDHNFPRLAVRDVQWPPIPRITPLVDVDRRLVANHDDWQVLLRLAQRPNSRPRPRAPPRLGRCWHQVFQTPEASYHVIAPSRGGEVIAAFLNGVEPAVIHRKVSGGVRSEWDAEASAIFTTLLTTAREHGEHLLDALRAVAGPSPLQAANAPT